MESWPPDVDGDVFRRLEQNRFDFAHKYTIDFNVDFCSWPPSPEAIVQLRRHYPDLKIIQPESDSRGYIDVHIFEHVTYDFVIKMQAELSGLMKAYNGYCDSWGVWQG